MKTEEPLYAYTPEAILSRYESKDAFWEFVTASIRFTQHEREHFPLRAEGMSLSQEELYDMYRGMLVTSGALVEAFAMVCHMWDTQKEIGEADIRSLLGRQAVTKKLQSDPKATVMAEIRDEWVARRRRGEKFKAVQFAREMHQRSKYRIVTLEAIKNAQTRWAKEFNPAG